MNVNVDEVRGDVLPFGIDDLLCLETAGWRHRGDVTSGNDDVALQNFAGMEREYLTAANDQVRLGAPGCDLAQVHQLGDARRQLGADEGGLRSLFLRHYSTHVAWSCSCPTAIARPIRAASKGSLRRSNASTILPALSTTIRSAIAISSSRSGEMTITAAPRAAASIRALCAAAVAAISNPCVGLCATMTMGLRSSSRPSSNFC